MAHFFNSNPRQLVATTHRLLPTLGSIALLVSALALMLTSRDQDGNLPYPGNFGTIHLQAGDSLIIPAGAHFRGNMERFPVGAKILVETGGIFAPREVFHFQGKIHNEGEVTLPFVTLAPGATLRNWGEANLRDTVLSLGGVALVNEADGHMHWTGSQRWESSDRIINRGWLQVGGDLHISKGARVVNHGRWDIRGDWHCGGSVQNDGWWQTEGISNWQPGARIVNDCRMVSHQSIRNTSTHVLNYGLLALTGRMGGNSHQFLNQSKLFLGPEGELVGGRLINEGEVTGAGRIACPEGVVNTGRMGQDQLGLVLLDHELSGRTASSEDAYDPSVRVLRFVPGDTLSPQSGCHERWQRDQPGGLQQVDIFSSDTGNRLLWKAAGGSRIHYFTVERSLGGEDYQPIAKIDGRRTQEGPAAFEYLDRESQRLAGTTMSYRLQVAYQDGSTATSHSLTMFPPEEAGPAIKVAQANSSRVAGEFAGPGNEPVTIELLEPEGRLLAAVNYPAGAGKGQFSFSLPGYPPGLYVLRMRTGSRTVIRQLQLREAF